MMGGPGTAELRLLNLCLVNFEQITLFYPHGGAALLRGIAPIAKLKVERFVYCSRELIMLGRSGPCAPKPCD